MHGTTIKFRVLVRKTEGKRVFGMPRQKVEGNIIMTFNEIGGEGPDRIDRAQDRYKWWAVVNVAVNLGVL
jgi:hypothetical protein